MSDTPMHRFGVMFIARTAQSLEATRLLASVGLNGDALTCGRTVVEMTIDFAYLAQDPRRIDRFGAYVAVNAYWTAEAINRHGADFLRRERPEHLQALFDDEARFRHDYSNNTQNWAGLGLSRRAEAVGYQDLYELAYDEMCIASHSGPGTLDYTIALVDGRRELQYGFLAPDPHPIRVTLAAFARLLVRVADVCDATTEIIHRADVLQSRADEVARSV